MVFIFFDGSYGDEFDVGACSYLKGECQIFISFNFIYKKLFVICLESF